MKRSLQAAIALAVLTCAAAASAQITFYSGHTFRGNSFTLDRPTPSFQNARLANRSTDSAYVENGRWEVCTGPNFTGTCMVLRQGGYPVLRDVGMNDVISSARPARGDRHSNEVAVPVQQPEYAYRRRPQERTFEAQVTDVRAVMGPPTQRCWVERQAVQSQPNIGGALAGAVVGGILGHQVGGGSGKTLATGAGVVGGALVGNQLAGGSQRREDVQRCQNVSGGAPSYWDVTYNFRGRLHTVQMTTPPGNTVTVNNQGEPRT